MVLSAFRLLDAALVDEIGQVLADQGNAGMGLQGDLEGQMTGDPSHDLADVPVLDVRAGIVGQVADGMGKGPGGGVESERHGTQDVAVCIPDLNVPVDGFGDTYNLDPVFEEFLSEKCGIGIGIVAADDHQRIQCQGLAGFARQGHFLGGVDFRAAGFDHGESAQVAVGVDMRRRQLDGFVFDNTVGAENKTEYFRIRIGFFSSVPQPGNHVVPTRRGTSRKYDPDVTPPAIGLDKSLIGGVKTHQGLNGIADDIRQLLAGFPVDLESVAVVGFQGRERVVEDIAHRRLAAPSLNQFSRDGTGDLLDFRNFQQLFCRNAFFTGHLMPPSSGFPVWCLST